MGEAKRGRGYGKRRWGYARQVMALTDVAIRRAKPGPKQYKIADGQGLYLLVTPAGGKLWRLKYRLAGKEKLLAFGAIQT